MREDCALKFQSKSHGQPSSQPESNPSASPFSSSFFPFAFSFSFLSFFLSFLSVPPLSLFLSDERRMSSRDAMPKFVLDICEAADCHVEWIIGRHRERHLFVFLPVISLSNVWKREGKRERERWGEGGGRREKEVGPHCKVYIACQAFIT